MRRRLPFLLLALCACTSHPPATCSSMCESALALYGSCLEDWGVGWEAAGYEDEDAFLDSCETWVWQAGELEAAAHERGELDDTGMLSQTCEAREQAMSADDATCSTYTSIDWNTMPWED